MGVKTYRFIGTEKNESVPNKKKFSVWDTKHITVTKCNFTITLHYMNAAGINRINKDIVHSEDIVDISGLSEAATGGVL